MSLDVSSHEILMKKKSFIKSTLLILVLVHVMQEKIHKSAILKKMLQSALFDRKVFGGTVYLPTNYI